MILFHTRSEYSLGKIHCTGQADNSTIWVSYQGNSLSSRLDTHERPQGRLTFETFPPLGLTRFVPHTSLCALPSQTTFLFQSKLRPRPIFIVDYCLRSHCFSMSITTNFPLLDANRPYFASSKETKTITATFCFLLDQPRPPSVFC